MACFSPVDLVPILEEKALVWAIFGLPKKWKDGNLQLTLIAKPSDQIAIMQQHEWADGRALFDTNTRHIWEL